MVEIRKLGNSTFDVAMGWNNSAINIKACSSKKSKTKKRKTYKITSSEMLRTGELERAGFEVRASHDLDGNINSIRVSGAKNENSVNNIINIIASCNEDIVVSYRDTLDEEAAKLAKKAKKPFWLVSINDVGDVILERQF